MTRPRTSIHRELFGILGSFEGASKLQAEWNAYFSEHGIDAFMDRYPCKREQIPERLSEMFHFDRRLYILSPSLRDTVAPLLDRADGNHVDVIINKDGIQSGMYCDAIEKTPKELLEVFCKVGGPGIRIPRPPCCIPSDCR